ncbi:uncharacterized protein N7515_008624 [Penicillium bovifimosum]|uniref:DUF1746 domain-containing protein n=1 Tax=Penicillium bovifimosum TaxID=126998 RepID=A0A9W9GNS6_9EURO|nr:uncharacterized protein N7515_008624 [Penicillium bovifimosum]KAJ5124799.1 hypothetical protein N7515_008624 [Penicillium bovifimosum]
MTDVDVYRDAEYIADVSGISYDDAEPPRPVGTLSSQNARVKKVQSAAKVVLIDRLLHDLDILIYCQLSALYYMDCSIILFALRAIVELIFFTPKAPPFEPTRSQPYVGAILVSNLICILFHAFVIRPEAGEETRGYLHGGLFIDFIGQAPVSTSRLLAFDLTIFIIDVIMLGLIIERVKTQGTPTPTPTSPPTSTAANTSPETEAELQDHDAEERGVQRQATDETTPSARDSPESPNSGNLDDEAEEERTTLLAEPVDVESSRGTRGEHPMDTFAAGQAVIVSMGFFGTLRDQWRQSNAQAQPTTGFVPSPETATFLRQRLGLQVGTNGRIERVNP